MKKLIFFAVCVVFVLFACNKSGVKPQINVSATIDGVDENFNTTDSLRYSNTPTVYSASISATNGTSATADKMELMVNNPTQITTGTYTLTKPWNPPFEPLIIYSTDGGSNYANDYVVDYTGNHPAEITITSVSNTSIQGTFSGVLVVAAGTSGATKTITNGKFNLVIK